MNLNTPPVGRIIIIEDGNKIELTVIEEKATREGIQLYKCRDEANGDLVFVRNEGGTVFSESSSFVITKRISNLQG